MSRQIQIRRGTTAAHSTFIGAVGEITFDTDTKTLRVHDGITPGGITLARTEDLSTSSPIPDTADYVIETQLPTADNNYTWYRKYASGWIEQGGRSSSQTITLPVTMIDTNYHVFLCGECQTSNNNIIICGFRDRKTTGFTVQGNIVNNAGQSVSSNASAKCWRVIGFAA